jgi:putative transposon-encoded protein
MIGEVLIKEAKKHGNGALIIVPKRWIGFMVRCEVKRRSKV